jgi:hypothetical protein
MGRLHCANGSKLAQPLGLVAHLSGDRGGCSAMWHTHLGSRDREVLTRRMSSTTMCGRPKGNDCGGQRPGVVVGNLWCGEVVLSGAVLGVWSNRSKRGWSGLSTVACIER